MDDPTPSTLSARRQMIQKFSKVSFIVGFGYILPAVLAAFGPFLHITFTPIHYLSIVAALAIGCCELIFSQKLKKTENSHWAQALFVNQGVATLFLLFITVSIAMQSPQTVIAEMDPQKVEELRAMCKEMGISFESIVKVTLQVVSMVTGGFVLVFQVILLMYYSRTFRKLSTHLS